MRITTVQDIKDRKEKGRILKVTLIITGYPTSIAKRAASSSSFTSPVVITIIIIIIIIIVINNIDNAYFIIRNSAFNIFAGAAQTILFI